MSTRIPCGEIIQGKCAGGTVYLTGIDSLQAWIDGSLVFLSTIRVVDTQDMGSEQVGADPSAVIKAGFWFGIGAAILTNELGKQQKYTVAIEFDTGERSLLSLNAEGYQAFKKLQFDLESQKRNASSSAQNQLNRDDSNLKRRTLQINISDIGASVKRAMLFLEEKDFETADEYFDAILDMNPENVDAYIGKLLVDRKATSIDELQKQDTPIADNKYFKLAYRFADSDMKSTLMGYNSHIENNITEKQNTDIYLKAVKQMYSGDYSVAAAEFAKIPNYRDSKKLQKECQEKISVMLYNRGICLMKAENYSEALDAFKSLKSSGYKDVLEKIEECNNGIQVQKTEQKYSSATALLNNATTVADLEKAKEVFVSLESYKDSSELIKKCDEKIAELVEQSASKKDEESQKKRGFFQRLFSKN